QTKEEVEVEVAVNHQLAVADAHPRHERCKYFGEEIQMDASVLVWFGTQRAYLHLAIDNATGIIVGAYFDWQETLNGYYHVFKQ
ncbi:transposase, partial [Enterococcus faecalis]|nr:transposase [Enterococcus faecalis]